MYLGTQGTFFGAQVCNGENQLYLGYTQQKKLLGLRFFFFANQVYSGKRKVFRFFSLLRSPPKKCSTQGERTKKLLRSHFFLGFGGYIRGFCPYIGATFLQV